MSLNIPFVPWENIPGYELLAPHLHNLFFEIYETDYGLLNLCILDQEFEFQRVFEYDEHVNRGFLKNPLKSALEDLTEDETAYEDWENDALFQGQFTIEKLEEMYKNGDFGDLFADNCGVYFDNLRWYGRIALGIPENMTAKPEQKSEAPAQGNEVTRQEQENHTPQRETSKWQETTEPAAQKEGTAPIVDPEKNEAAAEVRKKATLVVQRYNELVGYQRAVIINEAISLMHTAGIITDEQNKQLKGLVRWAEHFDKTEIELVATVVYEAADNYVMTGAATVEIRARDDSGGVSFEELETAYDIAHKANNNAHEALKLRDAIRKEMRKAERYDDAFLRTELPQFDEYADSCRETANMKQEAWKKELEATRTIIEELEPHIVPDIMTVQELQEIVDTTTGTDEEKDLANVATAIYDKIKKMYEDAERERLDDKLRHIFNTVT